MNEIIFFILLFFSFLFSLLLANIIFCLLYKKFFNKNIIFKKLFINLLFYQLSVVIILFFVPSRQHWVDYFIRLIILMPACFFLFKKIVIKNDNNINLKKSIILFTIILIIFSFINSFNNRLDTLIPLPDSFNISLKETLFCFMYPNTFSSTECANLILLQRVSIFKGNFFYNPLESIGHMLILMPDFKKDVKVGQSSKEKLEELKDNNQENKKDEASLAVKKFSSPYLFSWKEDGVNFELTEIQLGNIIAPSNLNNYKEGENVYALVLVFNIKMPEEKGLCVKINFRREIEGGGSLPPANKQLFFPGSGGCFGERDTIYTNQKIIFVVSEQEKEFNIKTGGNPNIPFRITISDNNELNLEKKSFIKILAPNGSEELCIGEETFIEWESQGVNAVILHLLENYLSNKMTYNIGSFPATYNETGELGVGRMPWNAGYYINNNKINPNNDIYYSYKIEILGYDVNKNLVGSDISDDFFYIINCLP